MALRDALLHGLAWSGAYWGAVLFFAHSPSRVAYGQLCGWWASLDVGYLLRVRVPAVIVILAWYWFTGILVAYTDLRFFYPSVGEELDLPFFLIRTGGGILTASPIFINFVVQAVQNRRRRSGAESGS